jgi:hypothetical protein
LDKALADIKAFDSETDRMKVVADIEATQAKTGTEAMKAAQEMAESLQQGVPEIEAVTIMTDTGEIE